MSVFLTPELEPMYGGTYYPKKDMFQVGASARTSILRHYIQGVGGYASSLLEYFNFIYTKLKRRKKYFHNAVDSGPSGWTACYAFISNSAPTYLNNVEHKPR